MHNESTRLLIQILNELIKLSVFIMEKETLKTSKEHPEKLLNRTEVTELLKINPKTFYNWVKSGKLKGVVLGGKLYCPESYIFKIRADKKKPT